MQRTTCALFCCFCHMSFDSCLARSDIRLFEPACMKRDCHDRILRSMRKTFEESDQPPQPPRRIFWPHIFNNSSPSCSTDHTNEASPPRTSRSIFCPLLSSHQNLITIVFYWSHERNQPPRTSCSIFCRHINNSSTIHHHRRRRRLHTIDIHGHGVGKSAEYIDCRHDDLEAKTRTLTTAWTWTTKRPTTTTRTRTTKATPTTTC